MGKDVWGELKILFERFLDITVRMKEAAEEGDFDTFENLLKERESVISEIEALKGFPKPERDPRIKEIASLFAEARKVSERIVAILEEKRNKALEKLRELSRARQVVDAYLEKRRPSGERALDEKR